MPYSRRSRGCQECLQKRVKCDERAPTCARCERLGTACSSPITGPLFVIFRPRGAQIERSRTIPGPATPQIQSFLDPYYCIPHQVNARQRFLIHHFVTQISSNIFNLDWPGARFQPLRDIVFRYHVHDRNGLAGILAYTINDLARLKFGELTSEAIESQSQCIRFIEQSISTRNASIEDGALFLVFALLAVEIEIWHKVQSAEKQRRLNTHIHGLRQMLIARGGFEALASNVRLSWNLHWFDLALSGALSVGIAASIPSRISGSAAERAGFSHKRTSFSYSSAIIRPQDFLLCFAELVEFYASIYHWVLNNPAPSTPPSGTSTALEESSSTHSLSRLRAFLRGNSSLLSHLSGPPETQGMLDKCAALHHLSATAWDLRDRPVAEVETHYKCLQETVANQQLEGSGSLVVITWALITDIDKTNVYCSDRILFTTRSLYVLAKTSPDFRRRFETAMMSFWVINPPQGSNDPLIGDTAFAWTPTQFENDLTRALSDEGIDMSSVESHAM